jgi:hypothetical protein
MVVERNVAAEHGQSFSWSARCPVRCSWLAPPLAHSVTVAAHALHRAAPDGFFIPSRGLNREAVANRNPTFTDYARQKAYDS